MAERRQCSSEYRSILAPKHSAYRKIITEDVNPDVVLRVLGRITVRLFLGRLIANYITHTMKENSIGPAR